MLAEYPPSERTSVIQEALQSPSSPRPQFMICTCGADCTSHARKASLDAETHTDTHTHMHADTHAAQSERLSQSAPKSSPFMSRLHPSSELTLKRWRFIKEFHCHLCPQGAIANLRIFLLLCWLTEKMVFTVGEDCTYETSWGSVFWESLAAHIAATKTTEVRRQRVWWDVGEVYKRIMGVMMGLLVHLQQILWTDKQQRFN